MTTQTAHPAAVTSPVSGLRRRRLPLTSVLAQSAAAVAPASALSVVPALVLTVSGTNLLAAFVPALLMVVLAALCIRPLAQRIAAVSGLYGYIAQGLGAGAAIFGGWSALLGYAAMGATGVLAVGVYLIGALRQLGLPPSAAPAAMAVVIVAVGAAAAASMLRGIRLSARVVLVVEGAAIAILVGVILTSALRAAALPRELATAAPQSLGHLSAGVVLAIGAFVGFESATTLGGESRKPLKSIPRAVVWTPVATGGLYLLVVACEQLTLRTPRSGGASAQLVTTLVHGVPALGLVVDLCVAASFFACTIASLNACARVVFCMAREGVLPRRLGRADPRFGTPSTALVVVASVGVIVPIVFVACGAATDAGITVLLTLSVFGYLGTYVLACASMPLFLHRIGEVRPRAWVLSAVTVLLLSFAAVGALALWFARAPLLPAIYLAVLAGAGLHLGVLRRTRPSALAAVGVHDQTLPEDLLDSASAA